MCTRKRIPFEKEQNSATHHSDRCPSCQMANGELHMPGCPEEICPKCQGFIIDCGCNCLSSLDSTLIIQALYLKFTDINSALQATNRSTNTKSKKPSYHIHAAMQFLFEQIDDKAKDEITKKMINSFPTLKPALYDQEGTGYYTAVQLAETFNVSVEEINSRVEALAAAGFVIKNKKAEDLNRSN